MKPSRKAARLTEMTSTSTEGAALAQVTAAEGGGGSSSDACCACWFRLDRTLQAVKPIRMLSVTVMMPLTSSVVIKAALIRSSRSWIVHARVIVRANAKGTHASLWARLSASAGNRQLGRLG